MLELEFVPSSTLEFLLIFFQVGMFAGLPLLFVLVFLDALPSQKLSVFVCSGVAIGIIISFFSFGAGLLGFMLTVGLGMIVRRQRRIEEKLTALLEEREAAAGNDNDNQTDNQSDNQADNQTNNQTDKKQLMKSSLQ